MAEEIDWEPTGDEDNAGADHVAADEDDFLDIIEEDKDTDDEPKGLAETLDDDLEKNKDEEKTSRFQQRIDVMTRRQRTAETESATTKAENAELRQRLENLESGVSTKNRDDFKQTYDQVKSDLFKAAEDGDTQKQVDLTEKMADMRAAARVAEMQRPNPDAANTETKAPAKALEPPKEALSWWNRNRWFNTQEHTGESAFARDLDVQLEAAGYDNQSPEYYEELDNRLQKRFPELYKDNAKKKPKPATVPSSGQSRKASPKDGRIRMTAQELKNCHDLGLTSEVQLRAFVKEREILKKGSNG